MINHFAPQMTNRNMGFLHARGAARWNGNGDVAERAQWFDSGAC